MARSFNGTSDVITLNLGATNFVVGPATIACIVSTGSSVAAARTAFSSGPNAGSTRYALGHDSSANIAFQVSGNSLVGTATTALSTSTWYLIVATKATGTVAANVYRYTFSTAAMATEATSLTSGNATAPTGNTWIGAHNGGGSQFWNGEVLVCGTWNSVLTATQIATLATSLYNWRKLTPSSLHLLNQDSTSTSLTDQTYNGATQSAISGTSVTSNMPSGFDVVGGSPLNNMQFVSVGDGMSTTEKIR